MTKPVLITSALPYVNNVPHLGNIIGSTLSADVYSRYLKMLNKSVLFLCGTDCYGTATEVKARKEKTTCRELCEKYHVLHKEIYDWFGIEFDVFGNTMTTTQVEITHEIFFELYINGHIEEKTTEQMRCDNCDLFLADRYLKGYCYSEKCHDLQIVANGDQCDVCGLMLDPLLFQTCWCSICNQKPEKTTTKHLYLRLADFTEKLTRIFLNPNEPFNMTKNAYNITKTLLENKLESRCITRDLKWGTAVPNSEQFDNYLKNKNITNFKHYLNLDDYKNKVFYVWFDAPIGYLSILKHHLPNDYAYWLSGEISQWFGKDNTPFHTIIFPATLLGSNPIKYPLVTSISCTEYLDYEGQKFSKSNNVGIFGNDVVEISRKLGIDADYWRYYLIHIRPENRDASFSWNDFHNVIKGELVSKIGNLINRCFSLTQKFSDKKTMNYDFSYDETCFNAMVELVSDYKNNFEKFKLREALLCANRLAELGNGYIQKHVLWNTCKETPEIGLILLSNVNYLICVLLKLLSPFMPKKSSEIANNFICDTDINKLNKAGTVIVNPDGFKLPFKLISESDFKKYSEQNK